MAVLRVIHVSHSYRVYCTWCGQTYISSSTQVCSLCGTAGRLIDPDSPEALADLKSKMQNDPSTAWPKTRREWIMSIVHTLLVASILTIYILFTGILFVGAIALLILVQRQTIAPRHRWAIRAC